MDLRSVDRYAQIAVMVLVPNRFLFRFEIPLHRCARPPRLDGDPSHWNRAWLLPPLYTIDGEKAVGDVWACWDERGLYVAGRVQGKRRPVRCEPERFRQSDHLRLMTDMRDTRTIRRATRFCQQWYLLPSGGGTSGKEPVAGAARIVQATEQAPLPPRGTVRIASIVGRDGWSLTGHIPATALSSFDPAENPRIGFFYNLEDTELGKQSLTVGDDLNWYVDPSTWPTAVLTE